MPLKTVFFGLVLLLLLAMGWSQRNSAAVQDLLGPGEARQPDIRFDNGSVRDASPASAPASAPGDRPVTLSGVRKCARGATVVYTDKTCPPGSKERAIGGTVNVVDGQANRSAAPAAPRGRPAPEPGEPTLRDRYMEAVINR